MLELKDGGKYVNRLGEVVTVEYRGNDLLYPFVSIRDSLKYKSDGSYYAEYDPDDKDLIKEYKEYKEPDDIISKAVLAEYIRNRLAVLTESEVMCIADDAESSIQTLIELCDKFGIVL